MIDDSKGTWSLAIDCYWIYIWSLLLMALMLFGSCSNMALMVCDSLDPTSSLGLLIRVIGGLASLFVVNISFF